MSISSAYQDAFLIGYAKELKRCNSRGIEVMLQMRLDMAPQR
jgi:hypothetical protein